MLRPSQLTGTRFQLSNHCVVLECVKAPIDMGILLFIIYFAIRSIPKCGVTL